MRAWLSCNHGYLEGGKGIDHADWNDDNDDVISWNGITMII